MFRGLVLIELPLDQAAWISARADQVFLRVGGFILIEFQLSLGYVKLLLHIVVMTAGGRGKLFLQLVDTILVGCDLRLGLACVLIEFAVLRGARDGMIRCIPESVVKSEVDLVVGELRRSLREFTFILAGS